METTASVKIETDAFTLTFKTARYSRPDLNGLVRQFVDLSIIRQALKTTTN